VGSATQISATSPAQPSGIVHVTVTTPFGTSLTTTADQFTYMPCTLTCDATVPATGQVGTAVSFAATATATSCTGTVTYVWTFGDGETSTQQNPSHTYASPGNFSWSMTALVASTICQKYGAITVVTPPLITRVKKLTNPFRLRVDGANFHQNCTILINDVAVPETKWKSLTKVIAKKGDALKAMVPAGQTVQVRVRNNDDGGLSAPFSYTR
jgi:PKD repeat protein